MSKRKNRGEATQHAQTSTIDACRHGLSENRFTGNDQDGHKRRGQQQYRLAFEEADDAELSEAAFRRDAVSAHNKKSLIAVIA